MPARFSRDSLTLDAPCEAERICDAIRDQVWRQLRRRGAVIGLSGGVDSSVTAALCVRALGADRVAGLLKPEQESSPASLELGRAIAARLRIDSILEDITPILKAAGCYRRRDDAIRTLVPQYDETWKCKIVRPGLIQSDSNLFSVGVESPAGAQRRARLTVEAYLAIVAATNFKQRVRKMMEYHHADRLQYAVVGTPNRLEHDQGFFVKNGDGSADLKPIAHLYKTQVYQLAEFLEIPEAIRQRAPTTDTYSMAQSQEEFYFSLPYQSLDLCLLGLNLGLPPEVVAASVGLPPEHVARVYLDIEKKRKTNRYLHTPALTVEGVDDFETAGAVACSPPSQDGDSRNVATR